MFKIVKILFFIDKKFKIVREKKRNLNITNKKTNFSRFDFVKKNVLQTSFKFATIIVSLIQ